MCGMIGALHCVCVCEDTHHENSQTNLPQGVILDAGVISAKMAKEPREPVITTCVVVAARGVSKRGLGE